MSAPRATPWRLTLHDGSGNGSALWQDAPGAQARFAYDPVTPATSSSGLYSGGPPRTGEVDGADVEAAWAAAEALAGRADLRAPTRAKGTGALRLETPGGAREVLVRAGPELAALVALLGRLGR